MARFNTKASAPAAMAACLTVCSSWTLMTITLSSGQRSRTARSQPRPLC